MPPTATEQVSLFLISLTLTVLAQTRWEVCAATAALTAALTFTYYYYGRLSVASATGDTPPPPGDATTVYRPDRRNPRRWRALPDALLVHEILPCLAHPDLASAAAASRRLCAGGRRVSGTTPLRVPQDAPTLHAALAMVQASRRTRRPHDGQGHHRRRALVSTIQLDAGTFHLPESQVQGCLSEHTRPSSFPNVIICGHEDLRIVGKVDRDPRTHEIVAWRTHVEGAVRVTGESRGITLEGLHVHSSIRSGIRIQGHSRDVRVEGCAIHGCGRKGVVVREFSDAVVRGCHITGNEGYAGIFATGDKARVRVDGCVVAGNRMQGIWCVGGAQLVLSNRNRVVSNTRYGIRAGFAQLLSSGKIVVEENGLEPMADNGEGAALIDPPASIHGPGWQVPEG